MLLTIPYLYWEDSEEEDEATGRWVEAEIDINPFLIESATRDKEDKNCTLVVMQSGIAYCVKMTRPKFKRTLNEFMAENVLQKLYNQMKNNNN